VWTSKVSVNSTLFTKNPTVQKFHLKFAPRCGIINEIEYNKGNDEEEYILPEAKRGRGWCKRP